ncbi:hypothetical protein AO441_001770 [Nakaseomyces glabratus]|uniref:Uncharacterized protein n=1 Tax=Candida glabrata TaxID=5478 RepID=A0A0W0D6N5_CANGB|nr:hypothetical protein AO441_001770 [Nakaseomyces glabratus]KTB06199.1 hypothetical protein AO440_001873 [Nakaseomyces glabratus]KTB07390.1 hypothetical protein AO439_001951 [Nakaseomyces glabratus]
MALKNSTHYLTNSSFESIKLAVDKDLRDDFDKIVYELPAKATVEMLLKSVDEHNLRRTIEGFRLLKMFTGHRTLILAC